MRFTKPVRRDDLEGMVNEVLPFLVCKFVEQVTKEYLEDASLSPEGEFLVGRNKGLRPIGKCVKGEKGEIELKEPCQFSVVVDGEVLTFTVTKLECRKGYKYPVLDNYQKEEARFLKESSVKGEIKMADKKEYTKAEVKYYIVGVPKGNSKCPDEKYTSPEDVYPVSLGAPKDFNSAVDFVKRKLKLDGFEVVDKSESEGWVVFRSKGCIDEDDCVCEKEFYEIVFYGTEKRSSVKRREANRRSLQIRKRASEDKYKFAVLSYYVEIAPFDDDVCESLGYSERTAKYCYEFSEPVDFDYIIDVLLEDVVGKENKGLFAEVNSDVDRVELTTEECVACFDENGEEVSCDSDKACSCKVETVVIDVFRTEEEAPSCGGYPEDFIEVK